MRFVIQRVSRASVTVEGKQIGAIEQGFLVFIGVCQEDTREIADKMKFSERQIYRFHGKALAHLKLPEKVEDVSECQ